MELRKCTIEDLDILREFSETTFYDTFKGTCSQPDMQAYLEAAFNRETIRSELSHPATEFYFLTCEGELAGYMKVNDVPAQSDINDSESLELQRIYIARPFQRAGLGTDLMALALRIARERGKKYLWLGVWERNEKALSFYKKHGFYKIGAHSFVMGEDVQTDYIMRKDL